jgi:excisionase family DNA binding protein
MKKKIAPIPGLAQHFPNRQVAAALGVSSETIRREQDAGKLRYIMVRRCRLVSEGSLFEYIESRKCQRKSRSSA